MPFIQTWKLQDYIVVLLSDHSCALTLSTPLEFYFKWDLWGDRDSGFFRTEHGWADSFSPLSLRIPLWIFSCSDWCSKEGQSKLWLGRRVIWKLGKMLKDLLIRSSPYFPKDPPFLPTFPDTAYSPQVLILSSFSISGEGIVWGKPLYYLV